MRRWLMLMLVLVLVGLVAITARAEAQIPPNYRATTEIVAPFGGTFFTNFKGLKARTISGFYMDDVNDLMGFEVDLRTRQGQASTLVAWRSVPLRQLGRGSANGQQAGFYWGRHFAFGLVHTGIVGSPGVDAPFMAVLVPDSCGTVAASVNDAGWSVGHYDRCDVTFRSFLRAPDGELLLVDGPWPDVQTFQFTDLADTMDVVGGTEFWGFLGLAVGEGVWEWVPLIVPDSVWTFAEGLNNKRQVVGTFARSDGICRGFLYTYGAAQPWQEFPVPGASCTILNDINDSGRIVGVHDMANNQWGSLLLEPK